jgi:uncharacterized protein
MFPFAFPEWQKLMAKPEKENKYAVSVLAAATLFFALMSATAANSQSPNPDVSAAWRAATMVPVMASEKRFDNGSVQLRGTLYTPKAAGKVPAVIVLHDASVPTRDLPLYRHLIQMLPPLGIAVFVYDRRGSGKSGGKLEDSDYKMLADDGIAALHMLARDSRIDPRRIGFWGLSQGGWLSLLAASRSPETAFAISISAPMTTADVQMNFAVANILRIKGYSPSDIKMAVSARTAVDQFERGGLDRESAQKSVDAAVRKPWFDLIYLSKTFQDPDKSRWAKVIRNDPLKTLASIKAPTFILYGSDDPWVPAQLLMDALRASAAQHPNITTAVVAGADHEMALSVPPAAQIDPSTLGMHAPDSPEYFALLASWLAAKGFAHIANP